LDLQNDLANKIKTKVCHDTKSDPWAKIEKKTLKPPSTLHLKSIENTRSHPPPFQKKKNLGLLECMLHLLVGWARF
jgi:hypothetical protein